MKDNVLDRFMNTKWFKALCIIDTVIGVGGFLFKDVWGIAKTLFYIAVLVMGIIGCVLVFRYKKFVETDNKNRELNETVRVLESNIHKGLKYIRNEAVVTMNKKEGYYHFEFIKEFEVISEDVPKWYSAQFYANKILNDKNASDQYYKDHVIQWKDLKVRALISLKQPGKDDMGDAQKVAICNLSDNSNYIPFNILYMTKNNSRALDIKKGTIMKLQYCYNVPVELWGSYLNRSISYFGEQTSVKLKYEIDSEFDIKVSELSAVDGTPIDITNGCEFIKSQDNEYDIKKINLDAKPFAKYRIWWDSKEYFGNDQATEDTIDRSQLTNC